MIQTKELDENTIQPLLLKQNAFNFHCSTPALLHHVNKNIAISSDSLSASQRLGPVDCINNINKIVAVTNQLALIWVPGHSGSQGKESADELTNAGAVVEHIRPNPFPQSLSVSLSPKPKNGWQRLVNPQWRYMYTQKLGY